MAGSVPGFSLTPQFDLNGNLASGAKLYVIEAGTVSTPQNAYRDTDLTILLPNPIEADETGRLPQFFVADGLVKLRLTTSTGTQIFVGDNLLAIGASSGGGGGGGTVDPTTVLATGDMKFVYNTSVLAGFVRANGRTIGSATSGATERANADTSALFAFLYNADPNLAVSGGRGANAAADFSANKTIALPDCRGRSVNGLDDMGNSAAGRLTSTYFGATPTTLGAATTGFSDHVTLQTANLPPYTPSGNLTMSGVVGTSTNGPIGGTASGGPGGQAANNGTFAGNPQGGISTPFSILPPVIVMTIYIKL